jgi:hypothetical protein
VLGTPANEDQEIAGLEAENKTILERLGGRKQTEASLAHVAANVARIQEIKDKRQKEAEKAVAEEQKKAEKAAKEKLQAESIPKPAETAAKKAETAPETVPELDFTQPAKPITPLPNGEPTPKQVEAGNYQKGHEVVGGLDVTVETAAGQTRKSKPDALVPWSVEMKHHYGYIKGVPARAPDKDHVDVFVKPDTPKDYAGPVFVIDQANHRGKFDEPKVMLGFANKDEAQAAYLAHYPADQAKRILGNTELPLDEFKRRLQDKAAFLKTQPEVDLTMGEKPKTVIQNRNRATTAMIAQMQKIAASPDYDKVGPSRDPTSGAPIVVGSGIPPEQLGDTDRIKTSKGRAIPIQYAVVDAGSVIASHSVQGFPDPRYEQEPETGAVKVIAGNGRAAGLAQSFNMLTANPYVDAMIADAKMHGVKPDVIKLMKRPILVRIMSKEAITPDIGDEMNVQVGAELSPSEKAANDARRIDLSKLEFGEEGEITPHAVKLFVQGMPDEEMNVLAPKREPTPIARQRLISAVFWEAYQDAELLDMQAEATTDESRAIMAAMVRAAPLMAKLKDAPPGLDVRAYVVEAVKSAINAQRAKVSLQKWVEQGDMTLQKDSSEILKFFASNARSGKRMGEGLVKLANLVLGEIAKPENDMLGPVPKRSRAEMIGELHGASEEVVANQGGAVPNQQGTARATPGAQGEGGAQKVAPPKAGEGFALEQRRPKFQVGQPSLFGAKPLNEITIKRQAVLADGRKLQPIDEKADVALADIDNQIDTAERLLACLNS